MKLFLVVLFSFSAFGESLHYSINWPSGLSLGEAILSSTSSSTKGHIDSWDFSLDIDASVPGFVVRDHYTSRASGDFCSSELTKKFTHGKHKADERITFDQSNHTATRDTQNGGGKWDVPVGPCARDALTFIQFVRRELAQGRVAPQQDAVLGAMYNVRVEYTGTQTIKLGYKRVDADRIQ